MAKIAVELEQALARRAVMGTPGEAAVRLLAEGPGWKVQDVVCTSGPQDHSFEEQHKGFAIALVVAGSFQYRASAPQCGARGELMTPGSLLLGNPNQCFECGHEHGTGDRCISFWYTPDYLERLAVDSGVTRCFDFRMLRLPPLRMLSPITAHACAGLTGLATVSWQEIGVRLASQTIGLAAGLSARSGFEPPAAVARVTRTIRTIERLSSNGLTLQSLAREAGLSPYHFLRTFERLTGLTPHQYLLRARLREAALRLAEGEEKVLDIALDCGFGDVSNFNRGFKAEFGVSPRAYRLQVRRNGTSIALDN